MLGQAFQLMVRILLAVGGVFYWFYLAGYVDDIPVIMKYIAWANIAAVLIPVGSNANIVSQRAIFKEKSVILFVLLIVALAFLGWRIGYEGYGLYVFFVSLNVILLFFERMVFSYSLKCATITIFYVLSLIGRGVAYIFVSVFYELESLLLVSMAEIICKAPLLGLIVTLLIVKNGALDNGNKKEGRQDILSTLSNMMNATATWIPMSLTPVQNISVHDALAARVIIFFLGATSLFYLQDKVLNKVKNEKCWIVSDKWQLILISIFLFLFLFLYFLIRLGFLEDLRFYIYLREFFETVNLFFLQMLLSVLLLYFSWLGAWVYIWHNVLSEFYVACLVVFTALFCYFIGVAVSTTTLLVGVVWFLAVKFFYRVDG